MYQNGWFNSFIGQKGVITWLVISVLGLESWAWYEEHYAAAYVAKPREKTAIVQNVSTPITETLANHTSSASPLSQVEIQTVKNEIYSNLEKIQDNLFENPEVKAVKETGEKAKTKISEVFEKVNTAYDTSVDAVKKITDIVHPTPGGVCVSLNSEKDK
jgi:hypothetical protein